MPVFITALAPGLPGATTIFGVTVTTAAGATTLAGSLLGLAGSLLLSTAAQALMAGGGQDLRRELALPDSLPWKRFVYGRTRATGTPIVWRVVGEYLYMCWLFNSRPSDLPGLSGLSLHLDARAVALTGNPFDFAGAGATATNGAFVGHLSVWIGRGDQAAPPLQILADAPWAVTDPDLFKSSDAARGCTVMWAKIKAGKSGRRQERWPNTPPLAEITGRWSRVWDPRDIAQEADDATTWTWSDNHRLCVLDALRQNPVRPYRLRNLRLDQWIAASDIADQAVGLKAGGTEARYRLAGTLVFSGAELEDLLGPIMLAGAADFTRSGGRLGVTTGVWDGPVYVLSDLIDYMTCSSLKSGDDLPTEIRATYVSAAREYVQAELPPWTIPGAQEADGGVPSVVTYALDWAPSPQQAMRVRRILGLRARCQRTLSGVAPPSAFVCVAGSVIQAAMPAPFDRRDGYYELRKINPSLDPHGVHGMALRCPIEAIETSPEIFVWDPQIDEMDIEDPDYDDTRASVQAPGAITVTSGPGVDLDTGGGLVPRFRFAFSPSASSGVERYEWQWALWSEDYGATASIDGAVRDGSGDVFGYLNVAGIVSAHRIRVRAVSASGLSEWVDLTGVFYNLTVSGVVGTAGAGEATFDGVAPSNSLLSGLRIYRGAVGAAFSAAASVWGPVALSPGASYSITATGLSAGAADFWVVPVTTTGAEGAPSDPVTLTIT